MNNSKCPHCGETRLGADFDWLTYHEQSCEISTLKSKLDSIASRARDWQAGILSATDAMAWVARECAVEKQSAKTPCPYCGGDDINECPCDDVF